MALAATLLPGAIAGAQADRGAWPSSGGDGNTKRGQSSHLEAPRLGWVTTFAGYRGVTHDGGFGGAMRFRLLTPDGLLLVLLSRGSGSEDNVLVALDPDDGSEVWRQTGIERSCAPVIGPDGNVWVTRDPAGSSGGFAPVAELMALDPATGAPIEGLRFDGDDEPVRHCVGTLHVAGDGSIVFAQPAPRNADYGAMVRAVDPVTATERWRRTGEGQHLAVPPADRPNADRIYVIDEAPSWDLVALDLASGDERGRLDLEAPPPDHQGTETVSVVRTGLAVDLAGGVLVNLAGEAGFRLRALDIDDVLSVAWRHEGHLEEVAVTDTMIVAGGNEIRGVGLDDGQVRWDNQRRGPGYSESLLVDAAGRALVTIRDGDTPLQSLDSADGGHRWTWREQAFDFAQQGFPEVVGPLATDGTVFVAGETSTDFGSPVWAVAAIRDGGPPPATTDQNLDAAAAGVFRHAGDDRFSTAAALSASHFPPGVDTVLIATGSGYPDALAGGAIGAREQGPLLLTRRDSIPEATAQELERIEPASIIVLGGPVAVSEAVEAALAAYTDGPVRRLSGPDRFSTAVAISQYMSPRGSNVTTVATGLDFPDALSGVASRPMLLVTRNQLPTVTRDELERLHVAYVEASNSPMRLHLLGGPAVVSADVEELLNDIRPTLKVEERLAGADRFETSARISASRAFTDVDGNRRPVDIVYVATGSAFPDALSAGAVAAHGPFSPVLLVRTNSIPEPIRTELCLLAPRTVHILGGEAAVSPVVEAELTHLVQQGCDS